MISNDKELTFEKSRKHNAKNTRALQDAFQTLQLTHILELLQPAALYFPGTGYVLQY